MEWRRQRMHDESYNLSTNRKDFRNYVENVKSTHLTRFPQNSPPYPRAHSRYVEMSTIVYYNQYMEIARLIHVNFICVWFAFDLCRSCCFLLHFILRRFLTPRLVNGLRNFVTLFQYVLAVPTNCCCCWSAACSACVVRHCLIICRYLPLIAVTSFV